MRGRILPALESLLHGLISLGLGALLAAFILVGASQQGGQGNSQLAADSLRMLWSPAIFAGVGVLLIANGLLRGLWLLVRRPVLSRPVSPAAADKPTSGPAPNLVWNPAVPGPWCARPGAATCPSGIRIRAAR